jgi:hypothetical protein
MMKKLGAWLAGGVMMFGMVGAAQASTFSWLNANVLDLNTTFYGITTIGSIVDGYEVTEIRKGIGNDAWKENSGSATELNSGTLNTYDLLWLCNGSVSTTFSEASTAVAFSLVGNYNNDTNTAFFVDGISITTQDMKNFSGTLLIEGLDNTTHTLTVTGKTHLGGAVNLSAVPLPGAVWLLGPGLAGLIGARRKRA